MARHGRTCWRCGAEWVAEDAPPTALRMIPGGVPARAPKAGPPRIPPTAGNGGIQDQRDAERWIDDGGSIGSHGPGFGQTAAAAR
jgi:hypothetical protein